MTPKSRKLLLFGFTWLVIMLLAGLGVYLPYLRAHALIHPERSLPGRTPADVGMRDFQEVEFRSPDGIKLTGWYVPSMNGAVAVFVHGHASNRSEFLDDAALAVSLGYGALLFDLRNHGASQGERTTFGLLEADDVKSAVTFVRAQPGMEQARIVLFGHSMGGAAVLLAAVQLQGIAGVVVESTYTSVEDNVSEGVRALTGLPPFPFAPLVVFFCQQEARVDLRTVRPVDIIAQVSPHPLLIVHGELDSVITVQNAHRLYEAAREPKQLYILPNVYHGGFGQAAPQEYPQRILAFLEQALR